MSRNIRQGTFVALAFTQCKLLRARIAHCSEFRQPLEAVARLSKHLRQRRYGYFFQGLEPKFWWWDILVKRADVGMMMLAGAPSKKKIRGKGPEPQTLNPGPPNPHPILKLESTAW